MNAQICNRWIRSLTVFGLVLSTGAGAALADNAKRNTRQRSDLLETAYEMSGDQTAFDASTAQLEDYLAYAAEQSPALKAAFYEWRSLLKKSGYAGALPDPSFSYTYYIQSVETRVGPQEHAFHLRQSVPWFGTLGAKKDITLQASDAAYQKFEAERLKLDYEVKSAYYEYYYLGREITITRENLELLTFWESVARAKYRVALKQHPDVIKAQVELGKLEDRLRTVEDMVDPVVARLRAATSLPDTLDLPVPDHIDVEEAAVDHDSVLAQVLDNNPDLKSMFHMIGKEEASKRLAGKMTWPDLFVGVDYILTGEAANPALVDSGKDPFMVTAGITLPIWFGASSARRDEAEAGYRKAQNAYLDARNQLTAVAKRMVFEYENALRKMRLYRDGLVPKAEQSLNVNYTAYQGGETDFLNVLDAQRQLLDFQLQQERSKTDLATNRARIEMITARPFPTTATR